MVEQTRVPSGDLSVTPFVIGMAGDALVARSSRKKAMKSLSFGTVQADTFVTGCAQLGGRAIRIGIVAGATIVFGVGVARDHSTWHQQLLQVGCDHCLRACQEQQQAAHPCCNDERPDSGSQSHIEYAWTAMT